MDFTLKEVLFGIGGSAGFITALIVGFNAVITRFNERRKRIEEKSNQKMRESIESRRLELEFSDKKEAALIANLWKTIEQRNTEIDELKAELEECNKKSTFSRPTVTKVYKNLRAMRREIESIDNPNLKRLIDETESILP